MSAVVEEIMARVETRLYQGKCPNSSKGSTRQHPPIELLGHNRRSEVECGRVALLRNRASGTTMAARLFCDRKACPECGPLRRSRLAAHYTAAIGETPVVRFQVARQSWSTTARRLSRAKASYLRIPAPGGQYTVFATTGVGDPVSELRQALGEAFTEMPSDLARVSSSRCWSSASGAAAPGGQGDSESGWELLGMAGVALDQVVEVAKDQGLYLGPVQDRDLASGWAEAHLVRLPEPDSLEYRRFVRRIRLHWPARGRRGEVLAA
jgi:hypothetical protein